MFGRMKTMACAAALGLAMAGAASQADAAITYLVNQTIGAGGVTGSITTNGDLGLLDEADITGWSLSLNGVGASYSIDENNSVRVLTGGLTATATTLFFNFSGPSAMLLFQQGLNSGQHYYCNSAGPTACSTGKTVAPISYGSSSTQLDTAASGNQVIASVTPEPATWAMMILGFTGVGAAIRRRRLGVAPA